MGRERTEQNTEFETLETTCLQITDIDGRLAEHGVTHHNATWCPIPMASVLYFSYVIINKIQQSAQFFLFFFFSNEDQED